MRRGMGCELREEEPMLCEAAVRLWRREQREHTVEDSGRRWTAQARTPAAIAFRVETWNPNHPQRPHSQSTHVQG